MQALNSRTSRPVRLAGGASLQSRQNAVFRALADPTRREILALLRQQHLTVNEIAANFRMSRPAVSKHLRILQRAGLVVTRQEGTSRPCALNARPLRTINDWLRDYETFWSESLQSLKDFMEGKV